MEWPTRVIVPEMTERDRASLGALGAGCRAFRKQGGTTVSIFFIPRASSAVVAEGDSKQTATFVSMESLTFPAMASIGSVALVLTNNLTKAKATETN